ncbi:MAG: hypothetical protein K2N15_04235 [Lachnospiraceae bacterium]|nr:hypothetical protein [Lachnospiraceae bacterium]
MKLKKLLKTGIAAGLAASLLLTGCAQGGADQEETNTQINAQEGEAGENNTEEAEDNGEKESSGNSDSNQLAEELKEKYAAEAGEYDGNVIKVNRDESLQIELGYNPWLSDQDLSESFVIYQDADLKYPVEAGSYEYDEEAGVLIIEPPFYGIAEIDSDEIDLSHLNGNYITEYEECGWGTIPQYYLAANVDIQTGEPINTPVITVIKINAEIAQAPSLVFDQTEDGYARFHWQEVKGAEGYLLFMINKDENGLWDTTKVFADVKGTQWESSTEDLEFEGEVLSLNERFGQYYTSEDMKAYLEETDSFLKEYQVEGEYDEYWSEYFGVIAYNSKGCSPISNLLSAKDLARMLPYEKALYSNEESFYDVEGVSDLPAVMCVTMCDGSIAQKVLEYDLGSIRKEEENNFFYITAKAAKTPFTEELLVSDVKWDTLDADLEAVMERQEKLKNKGGNVTPSLTVEEEVQPPVNESPSASESPAASASPSANESSSANEGKENETEKTEDGNGTIVHITANSALSEYMAIHMLETKSVIDLSDFPEAADTQMVIDAFFEAQYQNPLILGVQGGSIDTEERILYVDYDFDREKTAEKQQEIMERISEINDEILSDDMSDFEKEMAINTYLCENAQYDDAALENAEKYNFTQVDEDFYDSFTAYGILVDGVGVCASYSAAFKLLADEAGLDSIVVTGYLEGSVPHAWNKVKIEDEWYIVDATNNDNDIIDNALLNLSDAAAYGTLVENDSFVMDGNQYNYMAYEDELEYYHATDRYFSREEIADQLADQLITDGIAILRTEYDIDDDAFYDIAQQAADKAQKNISGYYWMGVIRLEE